MPIYKSLSDRLRNQHEAIGNIIVGKNAERLNFHPAPGKWSIHDNIAHLAKYQPMFQGRINTILKEDNPFFDRYKAEDDLNFETWRSYDTKRLLNILTTDREKFFDLVTNLPDDKVIRIGTHGKYGKLTIIQWTEFFLLHEAHHIFTIFQLANDIGTKV